MSIWKRLFGGKREEPEPPPSEPPAEDPPAPEDDVRDEEMELARLRRVGQAEGASITEAVALLRHHDGSARQTRILSALLEGMGDDPALDPVRAACARLLDERGEHERALELLAPARSIAAMMLAAELYAAAGKLPRAVSMIERVLARDIDTPGARERHERWAGQIGRSIAAERVDDSATVVAPLQAQTTFRLVREIARGGAGTIYEAEDDLLGRRLAYKIYHRAEQDHAQIEREARAAARLAGPGVLRIYDANPDEGWLATELVTRGSLRDYIKGGRVAELFPMNRWLAPLVVALGRVHAEALVHADVKPANVLFRSLDDPVLGDFGVCVPAGAPALGGTPGYMSPERLDGAPSYATDDVYALGRIIEDVLGARDDQQRDASWFDATEQDARYHAKIALACMGPLDERPQDALAVASLFVPHEP